MNSNAGHPVRGWSNTPSGKSQNLNIFTSIDYLNFRFDASFENDRYKFDKLLRLLNPDSFPITTIKGRNGYLEGAVIAPGITIYYGGDNTITREGFETSYLELKGEGCRRFESTNQNAYKNKAPNQMWIDLFDSLVEIGGKCTRLDIPVDDCEGLLNISYIKEKIKNKEYTTRLRKIEETVSYEDEDLSNLGKNGLPDIVSTIDSKHKGYSVTLGNRTHIQLCIYDKNAEQANKGREKTFKSWVRFESRFYHDNAHDMFINLYYAMTANKEHSFIVGALAKIFQLKKNNKNVKINRSRNPIDPLWERFIKDAIDVDMFKSPSASEDIDDNASWFIRSASKTFLKIIAVLNRKGIGTDEIITAIVHKSIKKISNSDLLSINSFLKKHNIQEFKSLNELKEFIIFNNQYVDEIHEETMSLIMKKQSPKEIRESQKEDENG